MGLAASQARFLQLTARRSNVEYQAQQINQERLMLSQQSEQASMKYNEAIANRVLAFNFNDGTGAKEVTLSYKNYKEFMNKQGENIFSSQQKYYLVSSSGNKIVVSNEKEINEMIKTNVDADGKPMFKKADFMIVPDLDNVDNFQNAIREGIYYFATREENQDTGEFEFNIHSWDTLGNGSAISDNLDEVDDAQAQAEYETEKTRIQNIDKKLELKLSALETERNAIQTEIDAVSKVIDDNIEKSFKTFG